MINNVFWANTGKDDEPPNDPTTNDIHILGSLGLLYNKLSSEGAIYPDTGVSPDNDVIGLDPRFVNSLGDFHLLADSPCIDTGTADNLSGYALPTVDRDGQSRPYGSAYDKGAYEYRP